MGIYFILCWKVRFHEKRTDFYDINMREKGITGVWRSVWNYGDAMHGAMNKVTLVS